MRSLFAGAVSMLALSAGAFADDVTPASEAATATDDIIYVYGTRSFYREDESSSFTRTETPLEHIPQSVFVITRDVIDDQAMTGFGELVRYVPGVTMGQGEGHRDAPVLRGNLTTSDFFVDGIRDDLQYLRDLYNVDRVDVIKGASALVFGRGTGGGAINRVSKSADGGDIRSLMLTLGSEGQARLAGDLGGELSDNVGARLNVVVENSETFRDFMEVERLGVAPAFRFELSDTTQLDVFAEYFEDTRTVDRGVPSLAGRPWPGDSGTYFGNPDISNSDITVATLRGVLTHELASDLTLRSVLSYGDYDKYYQNAYPGGPVDPVAITVPISAYNSSTTRENLLFQTDLIWEPEFAGLQQTILFGLEAGHQESANIRVNTAGSVFSLVDRGRNFMPDFSVPAARDNTNELDLFALLIQNQIAVADNVRFVAGLRFDRFDMTFDDRRPNTTDFSREDTFFSPRLGVIWEPGLEASFYAGWSRSYLPQSGEQFSSLNVTTAALEPEEFENLEVGFRYQPNERLLVSAAVYRLDRTNTRAPGATPGTTVQTGSQRAEGVELAIQGEVRDGWNLIGAMAFQNAEITSTTSAAPAGRDAPLSPDFSASLWNRVEVTDRLDLALGVIHQGDQFASISNAVTLPGYTRLDAGIFYALTDTIDVQLNIENLTNEEYWFSAHNDNNISPGAPTSARLTLSASF
ncbi:TonB-dependent siderophore receptor [Hyphobacterium sp. CCMP332]|uniref:TonB-dependent receptor n=1 Tax=Hyphobacterium sp. CCMP332 TaxID=2749086 RepID=UPI00164FD548|nr:TonB-dependent siderophore receptor [Hyphobacterium sp. CCMP332]QNL19982.1 TonB-dependent siderophore receptor [Hyphobacterium sp. CCMP332]